MRQVGSTNVHGPIMGRQRKDGGGLEWRTAGATDASFI
jgi:hypothetical protein